MDFSGMFLTFFAAALFLCLLRFIASTVGFRRSSSSKLPLPPGTMGYPYVGETFQLYSQDPNVFFASKQRRYGSVFKTHVLGCPCVMISSPEAAKFVLVTKSHLFKPTFPASKERMLGKQAIFFHQGDYHAKLRKLVLRAFTPDSIRNMVPHIESVAQESLSSWDGTQLNTYQEMKTYTFNVALLSILGKDEVFYREDLKRCYYILEKGYNSMPINLPGTLFHKAMKARKELAHILAKILTKRRQNPSTHKDLLGSFMEDKEGLSDEQIADNIIGVIFAARDTTASVMTWILKYLADNPTVLEAVTEEQMAIRKGKEEGESLTWEDTKKMTLTSRVVQETMRVATILSFTFREAVEDVEYEGYLIPKGWKVLPLFRNIHHNADFFSDPGKFDPSRFEVAPKPNTFMPFGNGIHSCPGNELAKLEISVLIHHLTTKYRFVIFAGYMVIHPRVPILSVEYAHLDLLKYDIVGVMQTQITIVIRAENDNGKAHALFDETNFKLSYEGRIIAYLRQGEFEVGKLKSMDSHYVVQSYPIPLSQTMIQATDYAVKQDVITFELKGGSKSRWRVGPLGSVKFECNLSCELRFRPSDHNYIPQSPCTSAHKH